MSKEVKFILPINLEYPMYGDYYCHISLEEERILDEGDADFTVMSIPMRFYDLLVNEEMKRIMLHTIILERYAFPKKLLENDNLTYGAILSMNSVKCYNGVTKVKEGCYRVNVIDSKDIKLNLLSSGM